MISSDCSQIDALYLRIAKFGKENSFLDEFKQYIDCIVPDLALTKYLDRHIYALKKMVLMCTPSQKIKNTFCSDAQSYWIVEILPNVVRALLGLYGLPVVEADMVNDFFQTTLTMIFEMVNFDTFYHYHSIFRICDSTRHFYTWNGTKNMDFDMNRSLSSVHIDDRSTYFVKNVEFIVASNGLEVLTSIILKANVQLEILKLSVEIFEKIQNVLFMMESLRETMEKLSLSMIEGLTSYIKNITNDILKGSGLQEMKVILIKYKTVLRFWVPVECNLNAITDNLLFQLAFKAFTCTNFDVRLDGLNELTNMCNDQGRDRRYGMPSSPNLSSNSTNSKLIAKKLTEVNILQEIFGRQIHSEILKRSHDVVKFMVKHGEFPISEFEKIWASLSSGKHQVIEESTFEVIDEIISESNEDLQSIILSKLREIKGSEWNDKHITTIFTLSKRANDVSNNELFSKSIPEFLWNLVMNADGGSTNFGNLNTPETIEVYSLKPENQSRAIGLLANILAISSDAKNFFMEKAMDALASCNKTEIVMKLFNNIIEHYDTTICIHRFIDDVLNKFDFMKHFLVEFAQTVNYEVNYDGEKKACIRKAIANRLDHVLELLGKQPKHTFVLNVVHVDAIWNISVKNSESHENDDIIFEWFTNLCNNNLLSAHAVNHIFDAFLCEYPMEFVSSPFFDAFSYFFKKRNETVFGVAKVNNLVIYQVDSSASLHGLNALWKIIIYSSVDEVIQESMKLLIKINLVSKVEDDDDDSMSLISNSHEIRKKFVCNAVYQLWKKLSPQLPDIDFHKNVMDKSGWEKIGIEENVYYNTEATHDYEERITNLLSKFISTAREIDAEILDFLNFDDSEYFKNYLDPITPLVESKFCFWQLFTLLSLNSNERTTKSLFEFIQMFLDSDCLIAQLSRLDVDEESSEILNEEQKMEDLRYSWNELLQTNDPLQLFIGLTLLELSISEPNNDLFDSFLVTNKMSEKLFAVMEALISDVATMEGVKLSNTFKCFTSAIQCFDIINRKSFQSGSVTFTLSVEDNKRIVCSILQVLSNLKVKSDYDSDENHISCLIDASFRFLINIAKIYESEMFQLFNEDFSFKDILTNLVREEVSSSILTSSVAGLYKFLTMENSPLSLVKETLNHLTTKLQFFVKSSDPCSSFFHLLYQLLTLGDFTPSESVGNVINEIANYLSIPEKLSSKVIDQLINVLSGVIECHPLYANEDVISTLSVQLCETFLDNILTLAHETSQKISTAKSETLSCLFQFLAIIVKKNVFVCSKIAGILFAFIDDGFHSDVGPQWGWNYNPLKNIRGDYVGLNNPGCICYMNSLVQQLYRIDNFRRDIMKFTPTTNLEKEGDTIAFQIQIVFSFLSNSHRHTTDCLGLFHKSKGPFGEPLNMMVQQDADEFFKLFLDKIEEETKGSVYSDITKQFNVACVNQVIGTSNGCTHKSERSEIINGGISLDVLGKEDVISSLKSYVTGDLLDGDNQWFCEDCKLKVDARKCIKFTELPPVLILNLKRFDFDRDTYQKIKVNDRFEFPMNLDMSSFLREDTFGKNKISQYDLAGVVVHQGESAESGHYYSYIKEKGTKENKDKWFEFNDHVVRPFDINFMDKACFGGREIIEGPNNEPVIIDKYHGAYMLIYTKSMEEHVVNLEDVNILVSQMTVDEANESEVKEVIKPSILNLVIDSNQRLWTEVTLFDSSLHALLDVMSKSYIAADDSVDETYKLPSIIARVCLEILPRMSFESNSNIKAILSTFQSYIKYLKNELRSNPIFLKLFYEYISKVDFWRVRELLIESPEVHFRITAKNLFSFTFSLVSANPNMAQETVDLSQAILKMVLEISSNITKANEYFDLLHECIKDENLFEVLVHDQILAYLIHVYMGAESPLNLKKVFLSNGHPSEDEKLFSVFIKLFVSVMLKCKPMRLKKQLSASIIVSTQFKDYNKLCEMPELSKRVVYETISENPNLFNKFVTGRYDRKIELLKNLSWANTRFSEYIIDNIISQIDPKSSESHRVSFNFLRELLDIEDDLQSERVSYILNVETNIIELIKLNIPWKPHFAYALVKFVYDLLLEIPDVKDYLVLVSFEIRWLLPWLEEYVIMNYQNVESNAKDTPTSKARNEIKGDEAILVFQKFSEIILSGEENNIDDIDGESGDFLELDDMQFSSPGLTRKARSPSFSSIKDCADLYAGSPGSNSSKSPCKDSSARNHSPAVA